MKNLFIIVLLTVLFYSCSTSYLMRNTINNRYNINQIDSVCQVEKIPSNLEKWVYNGGFIIDEESRDTIKQWLFIKRLQNKEQGEIIYTLKKTDSLYMFTKRVTYKEEKKK